MPSESEYSESAQGSAVKEPSKSKGGKLGNSAWESKTREHIQIIFNLLFQLNF